MFHVELIHVVGFFVFLTLYQIICWLIAMGCDTECNSNG